MGIVFEKKIGVRMAAGRGIPFFVLRWLCGCGESVVSEQ